MTVWALVFLIVTFPFCVYATWSDMKFLRIPNILPLGLVAAFIIVGPFVLPFDEYLRSLVYGFIALLASLVIFAAGLVPAGDLKFLSAVIPFVNTHDIVRFLMFLAIAALMAVLTHTLFGKTGFAPKDWASWGAGGWKRRFPAGFAIAGGLLTYLAATALTQAG